MKIKIGNVRSRIVGPSDELKKFLEEYLTFEFSGWVARKGGAKPKHIVQEVKLLDVRTMKFPSGFVTMIKKAVREELGIDLELVDARTRPAEPDWKFADVSWTKGTTTIDHALLGEEMELDWSFQHRALRRAVKREQGILQIPTGGGKTNVAAALFELYDCNWLFIVHTKKLMHQAAKRFEKLTGEEGGLVGDGKKQLDRRITFATFQTVSRALTRGDPWAKELLNRQHGVVVDECHTLPAATFLKVVAELKNAYFRFGISATPLARGDRKSINAIGALGPIIYRISAEELQDKGILSKPDIIFVRCEQDESSAAGWKGVYGEKVVRSAKRNALLTKIAQRAMKPALLFVKEVKHGRLLERRLKKAKLKTEFVWGQKQSHFRDAAIRRLEHGDTDVVICSVVFQEGVDIPTLAAVINGAAGKSAIATIQRVGRGSRIAADKTNFEVWDIDDVGNQTLEKWTKARRRACEKEGYDVRFDSVA